VKRLGTAKRREKKEREKGERCAKSQNAKTMGQKECTQKIRQNSTATGGRREIFSFCCYWFVPAVGWGALNWKKATPDRAWKAGDSPVRREILSKREGWKKRDRARLLKNVQGRAGVDLLADRQEH